MEVSPAPKSLSKHAVSVVMMAAGLLALSAVLLGDNRPAAWNSNNSIVKSAFIKVVHIAPARPGFAKVTLAVPPGTGGATPAASSIGSGLAALGRDAQLSFNLQAAALPPPRP